MSTRDEIERRQATVQQRIGDRGWSMQIAINLADELGVHRDTIYRDREAIIQRGKTELSARDLEERRAEFLDRLRGHCRAALDAGKHGPASAMLNLEQRLVGLDRPPPETDDDVASLDRPQLLAELARDLSAEELRQIAALKDGGEE
jgi:hypothetical protein